MDAFKQGVLDISSLLWWLGMADTGDSFTGATGVKVLTGDRGGGERTKRKQELTASYYEKYIQV